MNLFVIRRFNLSLNAVAVLMCLLSFSTSYAQSKGVDDNEAEILALTASKTENSSAISAHSGFAGKPISLLAGAETFTRSDLTLGSLFPINIIRRYNSKSGYDSPSGYGWAHNYDKRLYTYADGSVVIRKETGWKRRFTPSGGGYTTPVGETGTLTANPDQTFTYTEKDGTRELYDPNGRLASITDPNGNALVLSYDSATRFSLWGLLPWNTNQTNPLKVAYDYHLSRIEERSAAGSPTGAWVTFQYDTTSGRLTGLNDNLGRTVSYTYDTIGNLTSVTTPLLVGLCKFPVFICIVFQAVMQKSRLGFKSTGGFY